MPVASAEDLVKAMRTFEEIKAKLLTDRDLYDPDGKGDRIKKSGWRKLALAFGISDEIVYENLERDPKNAEELVWHVRARVRARGGRTAEGVGSASSRERKFAHLEHDLHALAHTRAKSRAIADLLGSSDLVAEELEGEPQEAPAGAPSRAPAPSQPTRTSTTKIDAGQRAIVVRFLEDVLGDDLVELLVLEESDGDLKVILPAPMAEANRTRFLKAMMAIGQGVSETSRGLVARMKAPKG